MSFLQDKLFRFILNVKVFWVPTNLEFCILIKKIVVNYNKRIDWVFNQSYWNSRKKWKIINLRVICVFFDRRISIGHSIFYSYHLFSSIKPVWSLLKRKLHLLLFQSQLLSPKFPKWRHNFYHFNIYQINNNITSKLSPLIHEIWNEIN